MSGYTSNNKRIAKNAIYMYVRFFVTLVVGLYISRVVLQILGVSDYGLYNVVGGILALFSFLSSSLGSATGRFFNFEMGRTNGNLNRAFNVNVALHSAMAILVFMLAEIAGLYYIYNFLKVENGKLNDAVFIYQISIIASCLGIVNTPYNSLFTAKEKFAFLAIVDICNILVRLILVAMLKFFHGEVLRLYAIIMVLTTVSNFVIYHWVAYRKWPDIIEFHFVRKWLYYKEVLVFSWWNLLATLATIARSSGSDMLINTFFGTVINGAYAISRNITGYVLTFTSYFEGASSPQITTSYSAGDYKRCSYLVNKLGRINLLMFELILFPLYIELDFILHIWLGKVPDGVLLLTQLNLVLALVSLTSSGLVSLINASGRIKWFKISMGFIFILSLPIAYLLFKWGAPYYVILILLICADIVYRVVQFIMAKRILHYDIISYVKEAYTKPFVILIIMSVLIYLYNLTSLGESSIEKFFAILICLIVTMIMIYFIGLTIGERNKIRKTMYNKLKIKTV